MKQRFTSRATAVNGKAGKLPAIYKKINLDGLCILDIGCGAEVEYIRKFCADNGAKWFGVDPSFTIVLVDGVTVCAFVLCSVGVVCVFCWLALLFAVGVRMARVGFSAIDIYLYILMA